MALFVQIDHFRKTDQKPTVKNHLFSISWFRSFNRTSFQQQLKLSFTLLKIEDTLCFNRTSFQQQLKLRLCVLNFLDITLQSYILSTTTETSPVHTLFRWVNRFNRTSFQQQLKLDWSENQEGGFRLQSYILSTTTETRLVGSKAYRRSYASIVHPFNNN